MKQKKKKSRNQSTDASIVHAQGKNTGFTVIYIKGKKYIYKQKTKKKLSTVATVSFGTVATIQNFKLKKKKWLTKMEL